MTSPDESPDQLLRPASAARVGGPDSPGPQVAAQPRHLVAPAGPPPVSARPAPASDAPGSRRNRIAIAVLIELLAAAGIIAEDLHRAEGLRAHPHPAPPHPSRPHDTFHH